MDCCSCFFLEGEGRECWLFKLGTYLFFIPTAGRLGEWVVNEIIRRIGAVHTEESLNNHYYTDH